MKVKQEKVSKAVVKYVAKKMKVAAEVKGMSQGSSAALTHSTVQCLNVTALLVQGIADYQRIGDMIHLRALNVRYNFTSNPTANAYAYRIIVFWSGLEFPSVNFSTTSVQAASIFQPTIIAGSQYLAIVNNKAVTVLADQMLDINSQIAATKDIQSGIIKVDLKNQKFAYQGNASVYGKFKNLYIMVVGYVDAGVVGTTSAGAVILNYDFKYSDL